MLLNGQYYIGFQKCKQNVKRQKGFSSPKEQNSKKEQIEHTRNNVIEINGIEYDRERREKETENRKEMKQGKEREKEREFIDRSKRK